jgi:hypothetical protein
MQWARSNPSRFVRNYAAAAMKGKVNLAMAAKFEKAFRESRDLLWPIIDSGYPSTHTA